MRGALGSEWGRIQIPTERCFVGRVAITEAKRSNNDAQPYLTLTIGADVPAAGQRLGVLTDTSGLNDPPTSITLTQTVGSGADEESYASVHTG